MSMVINPRHVLYLLFVLRWRFRVVTTTEPTQEQIAHVLVLPQHCIRK
jgi:hypothetical protein